MAERAAVEGVATECLAEAADGQDDPNIITDLIKANQMKSSDAIVVERTNRSEPFWFKFLYLFGS